MIWAFNFITEVIKIENDETLSDADVLEIPVESESLFIYVNETARNIGIKLTDEEIIPGVRHCSGSHAMMRVKNFLFSLKFEINLQY